MLPLMTRTDNWSSPVQRPLVLRRPTSLVFLPGMDLGLVNAAMVLLVVLHLLVVEALLPAHSHTVDLVLLTAMDCSWRVPPDTVDVDASYGSCAMLVVTTALMSLTLMLPI